MHRREAEAAAEAAEAERRRVEAEAQAQAGEERAAREAEKSALRRLERKFTVRLLGWVQVVRPEKVGAACLPPVRLTLGGSVIGCGCSSQQCRTSITILRGGWLNSVWPQKDM